MHGNHENRRHRKASISRHTSPSHTSTHTTDLPWHRKSDQKLIVACVGKLLRKGMKLKQVLNSIWHIHLHKVNGHYSRVHRIWNFPTWYVEKLLGGDRIKHGHVMCNMQCESIQPQIYWAEWRETSHLIKFIPQTGGETCFYKKDTFIFMPHMQRFLKSLSRFGVLLMCFDPSHFPIQMWIKSNKALGRWRWILCPPTWDSMEK